MGEKRFLIIAALFMLTAGCATSAPRWRDDALSQLTQAHQEGADTLLPEQFRSAEEVWERGEHLLKEGEGDEADRLFMLALEKGLALRDNASLERRRLQEKEAARVEAERLELEKRRMKEEEDRLLAENAAAMKTKEEEPVTEKRKVHRPLPLHERPLPATHTVKRGETLPLIAAQSEVYSEANLWPLLYRANRDQISDPRHIWPGQVLRIPRNVSRDEVAEARRYSRAKPLY